MLNLAPLLTGVLFLMSGTAAFLNVQLIAWFQQRVERAMMGRVMSVLMFASIGLMPFSLAAAGVAVKWSLPGTHHRGSDGASCYAACSRPPAGSRD